MTPPSAASRLADLFQQCRHIVIEAERRPHTSKHNPIDALLLL
jgi:hypothetical protein